MFGCECLCWNRLSGTDLSASFVPETFSLPSPLPDWPQGRGFASGTINLGALEVSRTAEFEPVWRHDIGVTFYRPKTIPAGFHCLGHYCQTDSRRLRGFLLLAREVKDISAPDRPPLREPLDYALVWTGRSRFGCCGYFWLPRAPEGYEATGVFVTSKAEKPSLDEARCVRANLTDQCEAHKLLLLLDRGCRFLTTRPRHRGMTARGVSLGTFLCLDSDESEPSVRCLKNLNPTLDAMPNLDQLRALIQHYGPTVFFHPDEVYFPSSVQWFFENGALLYKSGDEGFSEPIDPLGANLPAGGTNDGSFWIGLPRNNNAVTYGDLESAKLYAHAKPALGGTFTDIAMWVFCPFNGPVTLKLGLVSVAMSRIGAHVGDWEHFTLRICNFTGELSSIYYSQHSGGEWVEADDLEYVRGKKAAVYSSKNGHASYPRAGTYIQGLARLGVGIRNDAERSSQFVDSSKRYEIVAAEYLGEGAMVEPGWVQFMGLWGPSVVYSLRTELDKACERLPLVVRSRTVSLLCKLPVELSGETGPTGPKEKNNWVGDERG